MLVMMMVVRLVAAWVRRLGAFRVWTVYTETSWEVAFGTYASYLVFATGHRAAVHVLKR